MVFRARSLSVASCLALVLTPSVAQKAPLPPGVVARVDGVSIRRASIVDRIWRGLGVVYVKERIDAEVLWREADRRNITVSDEELQNRMEEYRVQFITASGRQPRDWDEFVRRFGLKTIEQQQRDTLLARKISDAESAAMQLTPAETRRVLDDLEMEAHKVHVRHVLIGHGREYGGRSEADARALAESTRERLAGGASWDDVARAVSDDVSTREQGGDLGFLARGQVVAPIADAAFNAAQDDRTVRVVSVPSGFSVFQVLERKDVPPTEAEKQKALDDTLARKREIDSQVSVWLERATARYPVVRALPYEPRPAGFPADAVATVDGAPITRASVEAVLWSVAGAAETDREVNKQVVKLEAKRRGIVVKPAELNKELNARKARYQGQWRQGGARYENMVARFGHANYTDDVMAQLLAQRIGDQEAARANLTAAERAAVIDLVNRSARQAHVRHILVGVGAAYENRTEEQARARAEEAMAKLKDNGSWDDVAKQYSDDKFSREKGGDLGFIITGALRADMKALETRAMATPANDASVQMVKVDNGYDVFQVVERKETRPTDADRRAAVQEAQQQKRDVFRSPLTWYPGVARRYNIVFAATDATP